MIQCKCFVTFFQNVFQEHEDMRQVPSHWLTDTLLYPGEFRIVSRPSTMRPRRLPTSCTGVAYTLDFKRSHIAKSSGFRSCPRGHPRNWSTTTYPAVKEYTVENRNQENSQDVNTIVSLFWYESCCTLAHSFWSHLTTRNDHEYHTM